MGKRGGSVYIPTERTDSMSGFLLCWGLIYRAARRQLLRVKEWHLILAFRDLIYASGYIADVCVQY
jgi:hypothetical protein